MTEQPPSASKEALDLAERIRDWQTAEWVGAKEIDALCDQRVSAAVQKERERIFQPATPRNPFVVDDEDSAPAERPAPSPTKTQWFVDPPRGSAKPTCTFDNEEAARRYADECPPHTRIVERPVPEGPQRLMEGMRREELLDDHPLQSGGEQDLPRRIGVEQPTQETDRPVSGTQGRAPDEPLDYIGTDPPPVGYVRLGWACPRDAALRCSGCDETDVTPDMCGSGHPAYRSQKWITYAGRPLPFPSALASTGEQPDNLGKDRCEMAEHREPTAPSVDGWQPGETAPRDHGREIRIQLDCSWGVPAYWDDALQTFVLSRPLHMESIARPIRWRPIAPPTGRVELGERSNTDPQQTTTSATSQAAGLPPTPRSVEAEGAPDRGADKDRTSPAVVVDHTERAREIVRAVEFHLTRLDGADEYAESTKVVAAALSAVASEHQAEIARLRKELAEVGDEAGRLAAQYQGLSGIIDALRVADDAKAKAALLARLLEPDVRGTAAKRVADYRQHGCHWALGTCTECQGIADAALTKIAEMLK